MGTNHGQVRGLVFDCDGTLADTMPWHFRAWQVVARRHGFKFSEECFYAWGGIPSRDIVARLNQEQRLRLDLNAVAKEKETEYFPLIPQVQPIGLVVDIAQANEGRYPMAVASSGTRRVIEQVLAHLRLRQLFVAVVTNEDVARPKPAPDIFLEAARRLGLLPGDCRAYEDADLGLQAIRAAGMEAVDVRELLAGRGELSS